MVAVSNSNKTGQVLTWVVYSNKLVRKCFSKLRLGVVLRYNVQKQRNKQQLGNKQLGNRNKKMFENERLIGLAY